MSTGAFGQQISEHEQAREPAMVTIQEPGDLVFTTDYGVLRGWRVTKAGRFEPLSPLELMEAVSQ